MPSYMNYHRSIGKEIKAYENRVRDIIDGANWGEEGRYKEIILMNYLKKIMPKNISVGTGFVRSYDKITKQIDIIIYDNSYPVLFSEGDFVVCLGESILGIIEVKTNIEPSEIENIIEKANKNSEIICNNSNPTRIFNGVFCFNLTKNLDMYYQYIERSNYIKINNSLEDNVNHIVLGENSFIKLWCENNENKYSVYSFEDDNTQGLSFSYFISNLSETIYKNSKNYIGRLPAEYRNMLYPIPDGKEVNKVKDIEIRSTYN